MAQGELDKFAERLRQSRTARERAVLGEAGSPLCPEGRIGCTFTAGARVFDRVSGQVGEVLSGSRENVIVSTTRRADG